MHSAKRNQAASGGFRGAVLWVFAVFCLLPSLGFVAYRLAVPSDGARLSEDQNFTLPLGLKDVPGIVVSPYESAATPLQDGDVILAVEGIPMEVWMYSNFTAGPPAPAWDRLQTIRYEILRDRQTLTLEFPLVRLPWQEILAGHWGALLFALVAQLVAGFVFLRRRDDPAAQALFIWAMSGSHTYAWSVFLQVGDIVGQTGFWLFRGATPLLWLIYWPASTHVALVFPRPFEAVRRRRWLIPAVYLASFVIFAAGLAITRQQTATFLAWHATWGAIDSIVAGVFLIATMTAVSFQYRRARTHAERQQIRLAILGVLISGASGLVLWFVYPLVTGTNAIDANVLGLLAIAFPLSLALAIWRHQLFDIDVIIRRTLQYSLTTLLLAGLYFTGVVVLQAVFQGLLGSADSPLVTVLSTLGIAAAFNPLRNSVQDFIDRRFYRRSYDAEQILDAFARTARDEVDLEVLSVALLGAVDETMQPIVISLWLAPHDPGA